MSDCGGYIVDTERTYCLHCGEVVHCDNNVWYHSNGEPHDHNPCPYRINPDNWR